MAIYGRKNSRYRRKGVLVGRDLRESSLRRMTSVKRPEEVRCSIDVGIGLCFEGVGLPTFFPSRLLPFKKTLL